MEKKDDEEEMYDTAADMISDQLLIAVEQSSMAVSALLAMGDFSESRSKSEMEKIISEKFLEVFEGILTETLVRTLFKIIVRADKNSVAITINKSGETGCHSHIHFNYQEAEVDHFCLDFD